jgi:5-(carboxyamino)imidazole ribonucleotide mutase
MEEMIMQNAPLGKVLIIMGSDSDLKLMAKTAEVLEEFQVPYEMIISSAHRTPDLTAQYVKEAKAKGVEVIVAGAGAAAHLAGVVAAHTTLPVIGVPIGNGALNGVDALYAMVQMPSGIPVATMAIDGAKNAGLMAVQILSIKYPILQEKMAEYKVGMDKEVQNKNAKLQDLGVAAYLNTKNK